MLINQFLRRYKKLLISLAFAIIFLITMFNNIPTWVLAKTLNHYSQNKIKLYETRGTFWKGSGLLVAIEPQTQQSAPLVLLNWKIKLGFSKLVDINFMIGNNSVADVYLNKHGLNLSNLNLSLSIAQVSELFGLIKNFDLSGNINISTKEIQLGNKNQGIFNIALSSLSSGRAPINPLGDYDVMFNVNDGAIDISSSSDSTLMLNGNGTMSNLSLKARIQESKKEKMLQFISVIGIPQPDGSYNLKIFPQ
ncbi:MAG: type II secretion system protein N [Proteobacteria bacterium]|jgi:hypothetical protein|nr:type II secretion system protein N [Pseudomonadota bacterium]